MNQKVAELFLYKKWVGICGNYNVFGTILYVKLIQLISHMWISEMKLKCPE